jgi:aspartyl-tRNA(Asn)/glutamyl-tRNA(Gln) amidotransferase subunit B
MLNHKPEWEVVIGLEVHAQVSSNAKLFSGAPNDFGSEPNHNVSMVDAAMPGMLPVLNRHSVEQAVKTGIGLNAEINLYSMFDRKNYFYADLPQGYQISQLYKPIVGLGHIDIDLENGETKRIGITRLHLEQDAGKSMHDQSPYHSFIDLNRSGVTLMEIVSEPELRTADEAASYMKKMRSILRYLGTCDGDMDKGNLRCDANVSVRKYGDPLGTRCEIKNLNSIKFIIKAIEYEAERQIEIIEQGGTISQETRLFDSSTGETRTMRSKEDAHDYRYFPDPDLLPLVIHQDFVDNLRANMPEMPDAKKARYMNILGLPAYDAGVLTAEKEVSEYFEEVFTKSNDARLTANWVSAELFGRLNKANLDITSSPISAENLAELLLLIKDNTISGKIAKQVIDKMFVTGKKAKDIVAEDGLVQVTDLGAIEQMIDQILASNADKVEQYKSGKDKLFGFFVGQVMKNSGGMANPDIVNEILKKKLS